MNSFDPIPRTFSLGSNLSPATRVSEAVDSLGAQQIFERKHRSVDGTHNDELVFIATAKVTEAAGVYTVVYAVGVSVAKQGTGWLRLTLSAAAAGSRDWMAMAIPTFQDHPIFAFEAADAGTIAKSTTQTDIKLVNSAAALDDNGFDLFIFGKRG